MQTYSFPLTMPPPRQGKSTAPPNPPSPPGPGRGGGTALGGWRAVEVGEGGKQRQWDVASGWLGWRRESEEEEKGKERKAVLTSPSCFCLHLFSRGPRSKDARK